MKRLNLGSMSIDDLWTLHESIVGVLGAKITAEKKQLEKRLEQIGRLPSDRSTGVNRSGAGRERRPYPRVLPKFRNPLQPSETWSGRGKKPRWMTKLLKSGRKMDDFRIGQEELRKLQGSPTLVP
jgi:DNA-binding protein H-NS